MGQSFDSMTWNHITSVLLILQSSSDTPARRNPKYGKFRVSAKQHAALDLAPEYSDSSDRPTPS